MSTQNSWNHNPTAEGWHWYWSGALAQPPVPVWLDVSALRGMSMVPAGSLGREEPTFCVDIGGYWLRFEAPALPA